MNCVSDSRKGEENRRAYLPSARHLDNPPSCTTSDVQDHRGTRREVIYSWGTPDAFEEHVVPNVTYVEGKGEYSVRVTR